VPKALTKGAISGLLARGNITIQKLAWDLAAGTCEATIVSGPNQAIDLVMGRDWEVKSIAADGLAQPVVSEGVNKSGCRLALRKSQPVHLVITIDAHLLNP